MVKTLSTQVRLIQEIPVVSTKSTDKQLNAFLEYIRHDPYNSSCRNMPMLIYIFCFIIYLQDIDCWLETPQ